MTNAIGGASNSIAGGIAGGGPLQRYVGDGFPPEDKGSAGDFAQGLRTLVDERVDWAMRNRTRKDFSNTPDVDLMMELIARGYAVWRPRPGEPG